MRNVGTVHFPSGSSSRHSRGQWRKPHPAPAGPARVGVTAKMPSKPLLGTFTNEGK